MIATIGSEKSLTPEKAMDLLLTVGADLTPIRVYLSELLKVSIFGNNLQPLPSQTSGICQFVCLYVCTYMHACMRM